jgi:hypothetical protein
VKLTDKDLKLVEINPATYGKNSRAVASMAHELQGARQTLARYREALEEAHRKLMYRLGCVGGPYEQHGDPIADYIEGVLRETDG